MLGEHVASLPFGPAGLANLQRIVVTAARHEFLADPAVDQRFDRFHDWVCLSPSFAMSFSGFVVGDGVTTGFLLRP